MAQLIKDVKKFLAYDIETSAPEDLPEGIDPFKGAVSPAYACLKMIGYQYGLGAEPAILQPEDEEWFRESLRDPEVIKVSFNGVNFDDLVLWREGYFVEPRNRWDMYLALKTVAPFLPSYSLKFANWYYLGDWHEPERKLWGWLRRNKKAEMMEAPRELMEEYCKHDVRQTVNVFRLIWEVVQEPLHWDAYRGLEMAMSEPLHEMILLGGEWLDVEDIENRIKELGLEFEEWQSRTREISRGEIDNALSAPQVARYFDGKVPLEISEETGRKKVRKRDLLSLSDDSDMFNYSVITHEELAKLDEKQRVGICIYAVRDINKVSGYLRSYLNAARYERKRTGTNGDHGSGENRGIRISHLRRCIQKGRNRTKSTFCESYQSNHLIKIAKAYSLSAARTRRILSSSMFGINFQNQNKRSKIVQLIPRGWLGIFIDSTQIENVVHIWASDDKVRRAAYEGDVNWSEYVWLCNQVIGGNDNRATLEGKKSSVNPSWSIYKQYKTIKLALNFGMGPRHFSEETKLDFKTASGLFEQVHEACPAIRQLQEIVRKQLEKTGFTRDSFGHIYTGPTSEVYRVVSFLVQGMGTGSLPKAMTVANFRTIHRLDTKKPLYDPFIQHPFTGMISYGCLTGTTHDECALRLSLGLPTKTIIETIRELMDNMEDRFSEKVGDIPLRAKIAFSITNAAEQVELDHRSKDFEKEVYEKYIEPGKRGAGIRTS
jgi:hypothetical protein